MFCDEHGTLDHCPECVGEDMQKEITRLQSELTAAREENERVRLANLDVMNHYEDARDEAERLRVQLSDMTGCACDAESLCKYHAMTTASGRSVVLRKQAEAVEAFSSEQGSPLCMEGRHLISLAQSYAQRLRQQSDDLDNV